MRKLRPYHFAIAAAAVATAGYAIVRYQDRRLDMEAGRLWQLLGLRPGARIAEIGAGSGEIIRRVAPRVGASGQIFATEADASKLASLRRKAPGWSLRNVTILDSTPEHCGLGLNSCDAIYMRGVYHHLTRPREMNESVTNALRPGGTLAVIDFPPPLVAGAVDARGHTRRPRRSWRPAATRNGRTAASRICAGQDGPAVGTGYVLPGISETISGRVSREWGPVIGNR